MFWTLKTVLGEETYDKRVHEAWVRIFSRMLSVIVPVAVSFEIKTGGEAQRQRVVNENALQRDMLQVQSTAVSRQISNVDS